MIILGEAHLRAVANASAPGAGRAVFDKPRIAGSVRASNHGATRGTKRTRKMTWSRKTPAQNGCAPETRTRTRGLRVRGRCARAQSIPGRGDDRLAEADAAVVAWHARVRQDREPAGLQAGDRLVQQQHVLEYPAG